MTDEALKKDPLFFSGAVNDPRDPLVIDGCPLIRCQHIMDFIDVAIVPDGTPWTSIFSCVSCGAVM